MKKLIIKQIKIKDWRVFEDFTVNLNDGITTVKGDNEVGKTNVASAITWVFNGNSIDGNTLTDVIPINRIDEHPSAKVTLECVIVDSETDREKPVTLEKEYKAVFLKDKSYKEHKTVTYINGVEMTIAKFNEWITANICNIEMFNVLCNVKMFTEQLKPKPKELVWQRQRAFIEQLIKGQIPDEYEMAKSKEEFATLIEPIARHEKTTEYLKSIMQEQKENEKAIEQFPSEVEHIDNEIADVEYNSEELQKEREKAQRTLDSLEFNNNEYKAKQQNKANKDIVNRLKELQIQKDSEIEKYSEQKQQYSKAKNDILYSLNDMNNKISSTEKLIENARNEFTKVKSTKITNICNACGQQLPKERIDTVKKNTLEQLGKIKQDGIDLKSQFEQFETEKENLNKKLANLIEPQRPLIIDELSNQISDLTIQLSAVNQSANMPSYEETKQKCIETFSEISRKEAVLEHNEQKETQLAELREKHKHNVIRKSELQQASDICKDFIAYRCNIIEEKINALFDGIKFKMFKMNKGDGELKETFEIYFNGKQYGDSLSLSTKLLVSYWITKSLQKALGIYVPIVLDNMESVSFFEQETDTQLIILEKITQDCPKCNSKETGRRTAQGTWICPNCGNEFTKELIVE